VDVPVHAFLNRDGGDAEEQVIEEYDEYVVVNGVQVCVCVRSYACLCVCGYLRSHHASQTAAIHVA
jgi:hypothetical protein